MSDEKLERYRAARLAEEEKKKSYASGGGGDNAAYAIHNIPEGTTATIRCVPDGDDNNPYFWKERLVCKLSFEGVNGGEYPTSNQVMVTVPCVDMFGDICPIIAETKPWWRDDAKKELARKYYKKRSYITSGFVVSSPFEETTLPENPIRRFIFGSSLLEKIKAGLADPDMEHFPTDYLNGCDFRIRKTRKQDYNNYDTSEWARRSRSLTEAEHIAIEQYGLFDLKTFLGTRPDADGIAMIKEMFHASLRGEPFDYASFGAHYRPYGNASRSDDADVIDNVVKATVRQTPATTIVETAEPVSQSDSTTATEPQDLLAKLRARASNTRS
jgi:hypothetical protein